ncbi:MAG TPA: sugar phosphate nucleotidyltransferase [Prolixibacteraceae bacterium]|nr:sugar phosphate nucleotidyltransferase [Prolixibacteraceae bacterium]
MKPTLMILAAGMGSRFGGLKQVAPVGPNGETIIDYSVYDAIRAGYGKVVFIIRESFADAFRERFEPGLKGKIETSYVCQELNMLPEGFTLPPTREKPWGTGHAILLGEKAVTEPFAVINADDFYGFNALKTMADFLASPLKENQYAMVGYFLRNTLSDFGSVSRGICETTPGGFLKKITETTRITRKGQAAVYTDDAGTEYPLTGNETVSMNIWGFQPSIFKYLEEKFTGFLQAHLDKAKSEFFIPTVVYELLTEQKATVEVLQADSPWFGVTYKEDQPLVQAKISELIKTGDYPARIF